MATLKPWVLLEDHKIREQSWRKGTIVYNCTGHDYGLASDDERMTGVPHRSVTLNADGSYPFFTVPESKLALKDD